MSDDPLEQIIASALEESNVPFIRSFGRLDFMVQFGCLHIGIEVTRMCTPRKLDQMASVSDAILIQGEAAAHAFAKLLRGAR